MSADRSAAARQAWETKRELYGPRGRGPVPKWRRHPSARAKRMADQSDVADIPRGTSVRLPNVSTQQYEEDRRR